MIELESITVKGLRSLADVGEIPLRRPTIITGANDGGKSTTLKATAFLLGAWRPTLEDFTVIGPSKDGNEPLRVEQIEVEGCFTLNDKDMEELGLNKTIRMRRLVDRTLKMRYEIHASQPDRPQLRNLEAKKLAELKTLSIAEDVEPNGPRTARESWLGPLRDHAARRPQEIGWTDAPSALTQRLPIMMMFSSTDEPDPEGQIRAALRAAYDELLEDQEIVGPVRQAEKIVQERLATRATELCEHVKHRCPELSSIEVIPHVTFKDGLGGVSVLAARPGGTEIPLNQSGAGRRRRVNLAVWEWTGNLVQPHSPNARAVVIAYDEPDTHLDYAHQRQLVSLIHQQCERPGVRMLVATHSLNLIDRVAIEDVVHLRIEGEHTVADRLISDEHQEIDRYLAAVSDAMGLRNSVLLHERCFVGVEGPTEMQVIPILFRLVTEMSLQSAGIALISGNGNDGALLLVRFLKHNGRRLAFVVVDRDSTEGKLFAPANLKAHGIKDEDICYVGKRELEDAFTDEQWATVANHEWPRVDGRAWTAEDFAPLRTSVKFSSALVNAIRGMATKAPSGKPGYLFALVQGLASGEEVPHELAEILRKLRDFAGAESGPISPTLPPESQRKSSVSRRGKRATRAKALPAA